MRYEGFEQDLYHVYESEVLGATMFGVLARLAIGAERKRNWAALRDLENQTMQRYLDFVADKPEFVDKPRPGSAKGYLFALLFLFLPWRAAMKALADGTGPFMEVFQRLESHAAPDELDFYRYVVAHEEAIASFAGLELQGSAQSLDAVNALLP